MRLTATVRLALVLGFVVTGCGRTDLDRLFLGGDAAVTNGGGGNGGVSDAGRGGSAGGAKPTPGGTSSSGVPQSSGAAQGGSDVAGGHGGSATFAGAVGTAGEPDAGAAGEPNVEEPWLKTSTHLPASIITSLAVDPNHLGTLYAADFAGGGVYKTTSSGDQWDAASRGLTNGNVRSLAVDPFDSNIVFTGTYNGLFRSTDASATWKSVDFGGGDKTLIWRVVTDPNVAGRVYVLAMGHVYANGEPPSAIFRSNDAGKTWSSLGNPAGGFLIGLVIDPLDSTHLLLGSSQKGVYVSHDSGANWQVLPKPDGPLRLLAYAPETHTLCVDAKGYIYASTDNGNSWQPSTNSMFSLSVRPGPVFSLTGGSGLWQSTDCVNWTQLETHGAYTVAVESNGATYLGEVFDPGIRRSADGATDWQFVDEGLENEDVGALALDPKTRNVFIAAGRDGIYRTKDDAGSWQPANGAPPDLLGLDGTVAQVTTLSARGGVVLGAISSYVFRSTDSGTTWSAGTLPDLPDGDYVDVTSLLLDPLDGQAVHVATSGSVNPPIGFYASTDQGVSFTASAGAAFDAKLLVADATTPHKLWALGSAPRGAPAAPYVTYDAGATWARMALPMPGAASVLALTSEEGGANVYVGVDGVGIFWSDDDGASWSLRGKPEPAKYAALVVDPTAPNTLYVATLDPAIDGVQAPYAGKSGVLKSKDGGVTWAYAGRGMRDTAFVHALVIDPTNPQTLYAGVGHDGVYKTTTGAE